MPDRPRTFRTLRCKLTLSATVTMIIALAAVTVAVVLQLSIADQRLIRRTDLSAALEIEATSFAMQLRTVLSGPENASEAERWLAARRRLCDLGMLTEVATPEGDWRQVLLPLTRLILTDATGRVLAGLPKVSIAPGQPLEEQVQPAARPVIRAALADRGTEVERRLPAPAEVARNAAQVFAAAPIINASGDITGLVYLHATTGPLPLTSLAARLLQRLRGTIAGAAPVVLVVALILAGLSTRGLLRRLERLIRASADWARGDFATRVDDAAGDELGALARSLDDMAAQLATLIAARKQLAALEERNTLARELHDRVKQNVFSVSMLLGSIETLLESDPAQARASLALARQAAEATGRELVTLIDQLRPDALDTGALPAAGLPAELRKLAQTWSQTHSISAHVTVADGPFADQETLSEAIAQALLLVAREALTNVARHSRADCVELRLELPTDRAAVDGEPVDDSQIRLTVRDDGVGFDPEQAGNGSGFGLHSMAERMAGLGGRLLVDSRPGRGTTVTATCRITAADRPSRQEVDRDRAA